MGLIELRPPSKFELRIFGLVPLAFLGLIGGLLMWRAGAQRVPFVLWGVGLAIAIVYYAIPKCRMIIYYGWMKAVYPLGWLVSHAVLGLVFYAVLTPMGLLMRLFGRDPMNRKLDPDASSYWAPHDPGGKTERYFRQF